MRILFLTQMLPYPPDAGPKVKTYHVLRYLAGRGHTVTLVSYVRNEEIPHLHDLDSVCERVYPVGLRRSRVADLYYLLRSQLNRRSFLMDRDDLPGMRKLVNDLTASQGFDVIHADQLNMAQFAWPTHGDESDRLARIFDAHNAVWTIVQRMKETATWYLEPLLAEEERRVRRFEGQVVRTFDKTLAVSEVDRQALLEAAGDGSASRIETIPIAVDTRKMLAVERQPGSLNIVTLGTLFYPPNADGIRWFFQQVFPIIRQQVRGVTLTIIGKNPPQDFQLFAAQHPGEVEVTGYVPDLTPYLEKAAVLVVPVRAGGGMRVRILEAFSRQMPVVTTTVGLEGIDAENGRDVLVADTPADFADAVTRLLRDAQLQESVARAGRALVEQRYDWQAVLKRLDVVYHEIETTKKARS